MASEWRANGELMANAANHKACAGRKAILVSLLEAGNKNTQQRSQHGRSTRAGRSCAKMGRATLRDASSETPKTSQPGHQQSTIVPRRPRVVGGSDFWRGRPPSSFFTRFLGLRANSSIGSKDPASVTCTYIYIYLRAVQNGS